MLFRRALLRTVCKSVVFHTKVVRILTHLQTRVSLVFGRAWGGKRTGVLCGLIAAYTSATTGLEQRTIRSNLSDLGAIEVENTKTRCSIWS